MNQWIKNNAWTLTITIVGVVSTFTLYGYRIDTLEKAIAEDRVDIRSLNNQQNQINIQLAQISVDIQYIKSNIDRLLR